MSSPTKKSYYTTCTNIEVGRSPREPYSIFCQNPSPIMSLGYHVFKAKKKIVKNDEQFFQIFSIFHSLAFGESGCENACPEESTIVYSLSLNGFNADSKLSFSSV